MGLQQYVTTFPLPGLPGEETIFRTYSTWATNEAHAFAKMMGDTSISMTLMTMFGDELFILRETLFMWGIVKEATPNEKAQQEL